MKFRTTFQHNAEVYVGLCSPIELRVFEKVRGNVLIMLAGNSTPSTAFTQAHTYTLYIHAYIIRCMYMVAAGHPVNPAKTAAPWQQLERFVLPAAVTWRRFYDAATGRAEPHRAK